MINYKDLMTEIMPVLASQHCIIYYFWKKRGWRWGVGEEAFIRTRNVYWD